MEIKEPILPENADIEKVTIEVYQERNLPANTLKRYWLNEEQARREVATHVKCKDCDAVIQNRSYCPTCNAKKSQARYDAMPFEEWDGETPVCIYNSDQYFFDSADIESYLEDNDIEADEIDLVICEPQYLSEISEEYWSDIMPENWETIADGNKVVSEKLKEFNEFLRKQPPFSWIEGKVRTRYTPNQ